ncbi:MAG: Uma2 family endonuclease [Acidobacteria bacterium]|nr:Uma2 family endonuclease [Acidobacteriota bacterium]
MSTTARQVYYTYAQYAALEEESSIRHEYLDGEIYAMAGGSPEHAALAATIIALMRPQLPPECRVFTSDLRVKVPATGLATYPDATVICGRTLRASDDPLAVVNPLVLVEVTSDSTEQYDRGPKLGHYQQLPSVGSVLIVSHREPRLTLHQRERQKDEWITTEARAGETVALEGLFRLAVDEVYRDGLENI